MYSDLDGGCMPVRWHDLVPKNPLPFDTHFQYPKAELTAEEHRKKVMKEVRALGYYYTKFNGNHEAWFAFSCVSSISVTTPSRIDVMIAWGPNATFSHILSANNLCNGHTFRNIGPTEAILLLSSPTDLRPRLCVSST